MGRDMIAAGIDLGGTKIEVQVFDADWKVAARNRVATPDTYDALVAAIAGQVAWAEREAGAVMPVGIGAAGAINPKTGLALTANLCASGKPLPADVAASVGRAVTYINDSRAFALSEAVFGAGQGHRVAMSVILGTGVGGGVAIDGRLLSGPTQTGGEFGHMAAPAHLVAEYGLPVVQCSCGRMGCIEGYVSGPGLRGLSEALEGRAMDPAEVAGNRGIAWRAWCRFTAELLHTLMLTVDPDVIVLGGGLSKICIVSNELEIFLGQGQFDGFSVPPVVIAQGGDSSGARGAAYAAWQADGHG